MIVQVLRKLIFYATCTLWSPFWVPFFQPPVESSTQSVQPFACKCGKVFRVPEKFPPPFHNIWIGVLTWVPWAQAIQVHQKIILSQEISFLSIFQMEQALVCESVVHENIASIGNRACMRGYGTIIQGRISRFGRIKSLQIGLFANQ